MIAITIGQAHIGLVLQISTARYNYRWLLRKPTLRPRWRFTKES